MRPYGVPVCDREKREDTADRISGERPVKVPQVSGPYDDGYGAKQCGEAACAGQDGCAVGPQDFQVTITVEQ